jgi:hypothetical protein
LNPGDSLSAAKASPVATTHALAQPRRVIAVMRTGKTKRPERSLSLPATAALGQAAGFSR